MEPRGLGVDPEVSTYHVDHLRQILWALPRKNAGTSIREAIHNLPSVDYAGAFGFNNYHTISVIRHPWDRLTSALYNPFTDDRPFAQKVEEEILGPLRECWMADTFAPLAPTRHIDPHLWPQWATTHGLRVDRWLSFDRLDDDWAKVQADFGPYPDLQHLNAGEPHDWCRPDGEPFDWSPLLGLYGPDFELCGDWEKV